MNPYWVDYQALKRGRETFADSAMGTTTFKTQPSALMQFIQKHEIPGRVPGFVWRIEYQKRGLPHAHILFWSGFDIQDIQLVESVTNAQCLNGSLFIEDLGMVPGFRQLINAFQIHLHSKRCRLPNRKCRFGYLHQISDQTTIQGHTCLFARDTQEGNTVPRHPLLLAYFRCHHCLEAIHSEQYIGYVLKYCSKNSDAGRISVQSILYEVHSLTHSDKFQYFAATRVSSASECFAGICGYWRHHMKPTVIILGIHLPGQKIVLTTGRADALQKADVPSPLEMYLGRPKDSSFHDLTDLDHHSRCSVDDHSTSSNVHRDVCEPFRLGNHEFRRLSK
jgi:hypothetical protein